MKLVYKKSTSNYYFSSNDYYYIATKCIYYAHFNFTLPKAFEIRRDVGISFNWFNIYRNSISNYPEGIKIIAQHETEV